jgi:parvulin-like peptidyl-prolyl isomerase
MKLLCILVAFAVFWVLPVRGELVDAIEAIVHDSVITYHEVNAINEETYASLARRYRTQPDVLEKELNNVRNKTIEELLDRQLILHEFKTAGYSLPESVINDLVEESVKNEFGDRATMAKTLEQTGVTQEQYRQRIRDRFIVTQLRMKNVSSEIIISPHKVESYYLAHKEEFKVEDEAKLRVIVLKNSFETNAAPEQLAEEILTKVKGGALFAEMATLYSQGSQRGQGGDWGWWEKTQLTKGLADIAFGLQPGQCSGVFSRSAGDDYWIVQYERGLPVLARHYGVDASAKKQVLTEERHCADAAGCPDLPPATEFYLLKLEELHTSHFKSLGEVRDQIEKNLLLDERNRLNQQWIDKLKKKTFVRRFS